jgi:hypothetical protein
VLKPPQVLGKADISVETLGDPFRPPDTGAVYISSSNDRSHPSRSAAMRSKEPSHEQPPFHNLHSANHIRDSGLGVTSASDTTVNPQEESSSSSASSSTAALFDSTNTPSPTRRSSRPRREAHRNGLNHRCAQDFWVPLSITSHTVNTTHIHTCDALAGAFTQSPMHYYY